MAHSTPRLVAAMAAALTGCVGVFGDAAPTAGTPGGPGSPGADQPALSQPAPARVRRLTAIEFDNSVRDLFGDASEPARATFPSDSIVGGFDNSFDRLTVSELFAEQLEGAAEKVAATAVADLAALLPCQPQNGEAACATAFIDKVGTKVYRRPLTANERSQLIAVYTGSRAITDFPGAIQTVIETMLQSPGFLYRTELGGSPTGAKKLVKLSPYEIAAALSYFLWSSTPDDQLMEAARMGALGTPSAIEAQARRMLADARATSSVENFFSQWLGIAHVTEISKDQGVYPGFTPQVAQSMRQETLSFVDDVVFHRDGSLGTLLTSNQSFVDADLAALYGMDPSGYGATLKPATLDPTQRAGLLTHASVIATHTPAGEPSPIRTGLFVRERLFCQHLPPPPPGVPKLGAADPAVSTRARFAQHDSDPKCAGCHTMMDPIGFGFEHYDAVGAFRATDRGFPITGDGQLTGTDVDGKFTGPVELAHKLAASDGVKRCFADQMFEYCMGRDAAASDTPARDAVFAEFKSQGANVKELMIALVKSDSFISRDASNLPGGM